MPELLPTLPGKVQGIVSARFNEKGRKVYTLQCQECGETEEPEMLILMDFHFCPRHDKERGHDRLCPPCRTTSLVSQGYDLRQAHRIITEGSPN